MPDFPRINKNFWARYKAKDGQQKLLIEESSNEAINHANSIYALIVNQAKGFAPVWLYSSIRQPLDLLRSYVANAEIKEIYRLNIFEYGYIIAAAFLLFIKAWLTRDILGITYDKVRYGDIIYDTYLLDHSIATIHHMGISMTRNIASCIARHIRIKKTLQSGNFAGVLVSHQVGVGSGVMLRVALRYGYKGFMRAGHHQSTFQCFRKVDEVYDYEHKPFPSDVEELEKRLGLRLEEEFQKELYYQISGNGDRDAAEAFASNNTVYKSRDIFNQEHKLDPNKKNVFVLLHAFNDYPHSHFRWMIFNDYYDWFVKTLEFARTRKNVNWVFKQHPSIKYYRAKDVDYDELFKDLPENIVYISENKQIDTRSLVTCADLVVTCLGSAGFELPAMGGVPALIAGDTFYNGLGFDFEPKTGKEYFEVLRTADTVEKLTKPVQDRAKASYLFIYKVSRPNLSACPFMTWPEERDIHNMHKWYFGRVEKEYNEKRDIIYNEVDRYIAEVAKEDFKRLLNFS